MSVDFRAAICERATQLGFDLCGFTAAAPPDRRARQASPGNGWDSSKVYLRSELPILSH